MSDFTTRDGILSYFKPHIDEYLDGRHFTWDADHKNMQRYIGNNILEAAERGILAEYGEAITIAFAIYQAELQTSDRVRSYVAIRYTMGSWALLHFGQIEEKYTSYTSMIRNLDAAWEEMPITRLP